MKTCRMCKKSLSIDNFAKREAARDSLASYCRNCKKEFDLKYASTEHGGLIILFISIRKKVRNRRYINFTEEEKNRHRCYLTKEQFLKKWNEHKEKFGFNCALSGEPMVFERNSRKNSTKSKAISVDRLNPEIGYTEDNIIFVSSKVNNLKGAVTKQLCVAILKAYEERGW
jgi:PP-loop superfamily ATP-utilizing enzyme